MNHPLPQSRAFLCPKCDAALEVVDSRPATFMGMATVRRRRSCKSETCGHRFTTFEISAELLHDHLEQFTTAIDASYGSLKDAIRQLREIL